MVIGYNEVCASEVIICEVYATVQVGNEGGAKVEGLFQACAQYVGTSFWGRAS